MRISNKSLRGPVRRALTAGRVASAVVALIVVALLGQRLASAQVEDDLREGDRYSEDQDWHRAAAAYDRAIKKFPTQVPPEAYAKRAVIFINLKDLEGGLKFLRETAEKQYPDAAELLEQEAVILWQLGKKGDAITVAEKAAAAKPSSFAAQLLIGDFYAARDPAKTANAYQNYLQYRPADLENKDIIPRIRLGFAYLSLARGTFAEGDVPGTKALYEKAEAQFETLQKKHGKANQAVVNAENGLCAVYTGLAKFDRAITTCERIVRDPRRIDANGSVWFNLATAYVNKKQFSKARTAATEYLKVKNKAARGYILMGDAFFYERNYQKALESYLKAEDMLKPDEARLKVKLSIFLGKTYLNLPYSGTGTNPNLGLAIEKLEAGRNANPSDLGLASELGTAYLLNKDDKQALVIADQMIGNKEFAKQDEAARVAILMVSGKAAYNLGKAKDAKSRFELAYSLRPTDVTVRQGLITTIEVQAYESFQKGDYKEVEALLEDAAKVDAGVASIHLDRAIVDIKQGQCDAAQKQLERFKGAKGDPLTYERLIARTYLCQNKPDPKKAAEHYAAADKEVKKVQNNLLQAEINTEWGPLLWDSNLDDAVSRLQDAVQFASQTPEVFEAAKRNLAVALFKRGWRSMRDGKTSDALSDFERASREPKLLKGTEPLAFEFSYALALLDKGDTTEAAKSFKALAAKGNQNAYLKPPYNKNGSQFFAAYANYRSGNVAQRQSAAGDFEKLQSGASGSFGAKIKDLIASSWEFVAYDAWKSGSNSKASKALAAAAKYADGDIKKRVTHNRAVLDMGQKQLSVFADLGSSPPEALVNLGILYDQAGKPKDAYEAWTKAKAKGANARDLSKWIDAKKRIYGFN